MRNHKTVKEWQYKNMALSIIWGQMLTHADLDKVENQLLKTDSTFREMANGHHCGYVETDLELSEDEIDNVAVHGGITYNESTTDGYKYGFDCAHYQDTIAYWNIERVAKETEHLADMLLEVKSERSHDNA